MHLVSSRLALLPPQLYLIIQVRLASTSSAPFPFPNHPNPTPHQIFHLPVGASQQDIKSRYYELVRAHHPDSPLCRDIPPSDRHSRFQLVTGAYDTLRGKSDRDKNFDTARYGFGFEEELERRRRYQWARDAERAWRGGAYGSGSHQEWTSSPDDRWKDRLIITFGAVSLALGIVPAMFIAPRVREQKHMAASANLAQARQEAREYGTERRRANRRRVREHKQQQALEEQRISETA